MEENKKGEMKGMMRMISNFRLRGRGVSEDRGGSGFTPIINKQAGLNYGPITANATPNKYGDIPISICGSRTRFVTYNKVLLFQISHPQLSRLVKSCPNNPQGNQNGCLNRCKNCPSHDNKTANDGKGPWNYDKSSVRAG